MGKTDQIKALAKDKSLKRQEEVLSVIKDMIKSGEKISFYSVCKKLEPRSLTYITMKKYVVQLKMLVTQNQNVMKKVRARLLSLLKTKTQN